jgi:hypothetical protein
MRHSWATLCFVAIFGCKDIRINSDAIFVDPNKIIQLDKSSLRVTEAAAAETYTISFSRAPRADVTITVTTTGRLNINGAATATVIFPAGTTSQTVQVSVPDETTPLGTTTSVITHQISSADNIFSDIAPFTLSAQVYDDDYAQVQFPFTNAAGSPSLTSTVPSGLTLNTKGSPASATGADGDSIGAYQFSGSQDLSLGDSNGLASDDQARTICSFVNPDSYPTSGFRSVVSYGENNAASDPQGIGVNSSGFAQYNYGLTNSLAGTVQVPLRTWSHICGVYDGSTAYVYVNGSLEAQVSAGTLATVIGTSIPFHIGRWVEVGSEFVGRIDEVRLYRRALTQNEIRQIGRQVQSGLVLHYDMTDSPAGAIRDLGTAAANGAASSVSHTSDRHWRTASAYTFGSASAVTASVLPLTTSVTYAAWVRPRTLPASGTTHYLMGNSNGTDGARLGLNNNAGTNRIIFELRNASSNFDATFNYTLPNLSYTHLAVTLTGTTKTLYIDGAAVTWTSNSAGAANLAVAAAFVLGGSANASFDLDDTRVYDRALTAAEVRILAGHRLRQISAFANMRMLFMGETALCTAVPCTEAGAVTNFPDASNSGHNLTASGSRRPVYRANAINGRPGLSFSSAVPHYLLSSASGTGLNTTYTFFWVVTQNAGSLGGWVFSTGSSCFSDNAWSIDGGATSCNIGFMGGITVPATGPYLMSIKRTATNAQTGYVGGVTPGATSSGSANFTYSLNSTLAMGTRWAATGEHFTGIVSELLHFNTPLGDADRELVECYLSSKYNIAIGHACP